MYSMPTSVQQPGLNPQALIFGEVVKIKGGGVYIVDCCPPCGLVKKTLIIIK